MGPNARRLLVMSLAVSPAIAGCGSAEQIKFDTTGSAGTSSGGSGGAGATGTTSGSGATGAVGGTGGTGATGAVGGTGGTGGTGAVGGTGGTGAVGGTGGTGGTGGSAMCGDGVASPDEACDGADFKGGSCKDYGYSAGPGLACTASCLIDASGCKPTCNGALLEPGEKCDGPLLGTATCKDFGYSTSAGLQCNPTCDGLDSSGCSSTCDGILEPSEDCDGANLNGHSCKEFGFASGDGLVCTACKLDSTGCKAVCGNGKAEPGEECDDGNLMSGDGCSATCTAEVLSCNAIPVTLGLGTQMLTGTTVGGGSHSAACASAATDQVYAVTPTSGGFLTATLARTGTEYPSVLYARSTCDGAANTILCADSKDPAGAMALNGGEVISFPVEANKLVYIFVDGATAADTGNYKLVLDLSAGTNCNDPVPVTIEKGTPMTLLGLTNGKTPSTGGSCGGFSAEDVVYEVTYAGGGNVSAGISAAGTSYNSIIYARHDCNNNFGEIGCNNANGNGGDNLSFDSQNDPTIYVWIDGNMGANGNYTLVLTPAP